MDNKCSFMIQDRCLIIICFILIGFLFYKQNIREDMENLNSVNNNNLSSTTDVNNLNSTTDVNNLNSTTDVNNLNSTIDVNNLNSTTDVNNLNSTTDVNNLNSTIDVNNIVEITSNNDLLTEQIKEEIRLIYNSDNILREQIKEEIRLIYNADIESIRNLAEVAIKLQEEGLTIPGDLTVMGNLKLGSQETKQWMFTSNEDNDNLLIGRINNSYFNKDKAFKLTPKINNNSELEYIDNNLVPSKVVVAWSGEIEDIPKGWALCDGTNDTPNLSGRFIFGWSKDSKDKELGYTNGSETITLSTKELPSHSHSYNQKLFRGYTEKDGPGKNQTYYKDGGVDSKDTGNTGSGQPIKIMPPYYVLAYIMKL